MRIHRTGFWPFLLSIILVGLLGGCGHENKDITAPDLTMDPLFGQNQNPTGGRALMVTDGNLNLSGTVEAGAVVQIEINSGEVQPATAGQRSPWAKR